MEPKPGPSGISKAGAAALDFVRSPRRSYTRLKDEKQLSKGEISLKFFLLSHVDKPKSARIKIKVPKETTTIDALCTLSVVGKMPHLFMSTYSIYVYWPDNQCERRLEDHENVVTVKCEQRSIFKGSFKWYISDKAPTMYAFYEDPKGYFNHSPELTVEFADPGKNRDEKICKVENLANRDDLSVIMYSRTEVRNKEMTQWAEGCYLLLRNGCLYSIEDEPTLKKYLALSLKDFIRMVKETFEVRYILNVRCWDLFLCWHSPFYKGILFRPMVTYVEKGGRIRPTAAEKGAKLKDIHVYGLTLGLSDVWNWAVRLTKYCKELREGYMESSILRPKPSVGRPGPAKDMEENPDFAHVIRTSSGKIKIVSKEIWRKFEEQEGRGLAPDPYVYNVAMGFYIKRGKFHPAQPNPVTPLRFNQIIKLHQHELWYHGPLNRTNATLLIAKYGDRCFFFRESSSRKETFVLTFKAAGEIHHITINYMYYAKKEEFYLTLDKGRNFFTHLSAIMQYYTCNTGSLPDQLGQFVPNPENIAFQEKSKSTIPTPSSVGDTLSIPGPSSVGGHSSIRGPSSVGCPSSPAATTISEELQPTATHEPQLHISEAQPEYLISMESSTSSSD